MRKNGVHVVVLAYPAQGHINPLLQFAKRLASKGLKATLATTHYTLPHIHAQAQGLVAIEPISDGFDHGGFTQAPSLEAYLESFRTVGSRTLTELILRLNSSGPPVACLVFDSLLQWALGVARQLGIYGAVFLTNSASVCSIYWKIKQGFLDLPLGPETLPVSLPGIPPLGLSDLPSFIAQPGSHSAYLAAILEQFQSLEDNDWVFLNSFEELESEVSKSQSGTWPVVMVGPLVPSAFLDQQIEGDTQYGASLWTPAGDHYLRWLDTKPPRSVVYVSFGSMAEIPADQAGEIAQALQESQRPFIWVVKEAQKPNLPTSFLGSLGPMGLVISWCNQLEVLAHGAVGCFVTHCGWNSVLEGLSLGVPMVAMPRWSDQPMNAKCVEELWKVGVRAKKDEKGITRSEELKRRIREVMEGDKSQVMRCNASAWREAAEKAVSLGGSSDENVNKFVQVLLTRESEKYSRVNYILVPSFIPISICFP